VFRTRAGKTKYLLVEAEGEESPCPAEPELTFQRSRYGWKRRKRLGWQRGKNWRPKARRAWTTAAMTAAAPGWRPKAIIPGWFRVDLIASPQYT
jgi:hypothetical protein